MTVIDKILQPAIEEIKAASDLLGSKCKEVLDCLSNQTPYIGSNVIDDPDNEKLQTELRSYDTVVVCKNCGLHGKILVPFGETIREYSRSQGCPKCGTDNLFPVGSR